MDRVGEYRRIVRELMTRYGEDKPSHGKIDTEVVFDEERGRYLVLYIGWQGMTRLYGVYLHADVADGQVLIHYDGSEEGVNAELIEAGVAEEDIVMTYAQPVDEGVEIELHGLSLE